VHAGRGVTARRLFMEPVLCPWCGGANLFQEDDYGLELDSEYWTIHHWECLDCAQSFDKIDVLPATDSFETINHESTIH
jgi:hypothetical protein